MITFKNIILFSAFNMCFVLSAGCNSGDADRGPTGELVGTVTFEGDPVTEGVVQLTHTTKGVGGTGTIGPDGSFKVNTAQGGLPVGEYQISVIPPMVEVDSGPNSPKSESPKEMPNIPQKYRSPSTSGFKVDIQEGENTFDVKMDNKK